MSDIEIRREGLPRPEDCKGSVTYVNYAASGGQIELKLVRSTFFINVQGPVSGCTEIIYWSEIWWRHATRLPGEEILWVHTEWQQLRGDAGK